MQQVLINLVEALTIAAALGFATLFYKSVRTLDRVVIRLNQHEKEIAALKRFTSGANECSQTR